MTDTLFDKFCKDIIEDTSTTEYALLVDAVHHFAVLSPSLYQMWIPAYCIEILIKYGLLEDSKSFPCVMAPRFAAFIALYKL